MLISVFSKCFSNHTHLANVSLTSHILPAAFQKVAIESLELSTLALLARCSIRLSYTGFGQQVRFTKFGFELVQ